MKNYFTKILVAKDIWKVPVNESTCTNLINDGNAADVIVVSLMLFFPSSWNQSTEYSQCKSNDWFLHDERLAITTVEWHQIKISVTHWIRKYLYEMRYSDFSKFSLSHKGSSI